jgi:putative GTP pyrophosphokinase
MSAHSKNRVKKAGEILRRLESATPEEMLEAIDVIDEWRAGHAKPLRRVNADLRHYVRKVGVEQPEVTQRLKRFATIVDKLRRQPTMALSQMEDIGGARVTVPTQDQVDAIVRNLRSQPRWNIRRVREYVEGRDPGPKSDGYRAVHVIVVKDGCYIEMQLRTPRQDAWAQSVEQDTRRLGEGLKFGSGPDDLREYYVLVSELLAMRERHEEPASVLMEQLTSRFAATRRYFPSEEPR